MKNYYAETSIDFLDISIDENNPDGTQPYEGRTVDSFTVNAKTYKVALVKIFDKAIDEFTKNYDQQENILKSFHIDVFYETSDDARSS